MNRVHKIKKSVYDEISYLRNLKATKEDIDSLSTSINTLKEVLGLLQTIKVDYKKSRGKSARRVTRYGGLDKSTTYDSISNAAKANGTTSSNICNAINGKVKTAGGYKWKYEN